MSVFCWCQFHHTSVSYCPHSSVYVCCWPSCPEFCHDVSDHQMPHVAPVILPQLLKVILQAQVGSLPWAYAHYRYLFSAMSHTLPPPPPPTPGVQCSHSQQGCAHLQYHCLSHLCHERSFPSTDSPSSLLINHMYMYKNCTVVISLLSPLLFSPRLTQEAIKTLLLPSLPDFLATFVHILSSSDPTNTDPGLVKEVVMTLCALLRSLPRALTPHIMQIVTPVWNLLVSSTPVYPFPSKLVTCHPRIG